MISKGAVPDKARGLFHMAPTYFLGSRGQLFPSAAVDHPFCIHDCLILDIFHMKQAANYYSVFQGALWRIWALENFILLPLPSTEGPIQND